MRNSLILRNLNLTFLEPCGIIVTMSSPFKDDWKMRSDYLYAKRKQDMRKLAPLLIEWLEEYREKNAPEAKKVIDISGTM